MPDTAVTAFTCNNPFALHISQFSSVAQSCLTLCSCTDCSTPCSLVHHQLLKLALTHVHWVHDAIQPSHPLSSPSLAFNLSQHPGLFKWVSSSHQVAKVLEFQLQHQFSSVQSLSHVRLFAAPWIAARQASLSITNSWSLPKLTSIESVMPLAPLDSAPNWWSTELWA